MNLKENVIVVGVAAVAVVGLLYYLQKFVPKVVKDGVEAAGVLAWEATKGIAHPLDALGISPNTYPDGAPKYAVSAPWTSGYDIAGSVGVKDAVSENDAGIAWNLLGG